MRMRFNRFFGNFNSRCPNFNSRFYVIAVFFAMFFIIFLLLNGLSVRLFIVASHSPNFSPFFPFFPSANNKASFV